MELLVVGGLLAAWLLLRLSNRFGRKRRAEASPNRDLPGPTSHSHSANSLTKSFNHLFLAMALVGLTVTAGLYGVGKSSREDALVLGGFFVVFCFVGAWSMRAASKGTAELRPDDLMVRSGGKTSTIRWEHIAGVGVSTWAKTRGLDGIWPRLSRTDLNDQFVELRLNRAIRMGDLGSRYGTDVDGVPFGKTFRIFVENPTTFVELATPYISRSAAIRAASV